MEQSCEPTPDCPYYEQGCYFDTHHLYYPASRYIGFIAHRFRTLPENQVELCRHEHETLHRTQEPPAMPSQEFMAGYLISSEHKLGAGVIKQIRKELKRGKNQR